MLQWRPIGSCSGLAIYSSSFSARNIPLCSVAGPDSSVFPISREAFCVKSSPVVVYTLVINSTIATMKMPNATIRMTARISSGTGNSSDKLSASHNYYVFISFKYNLVVLGAVKSCRHDGGCILYRSDRRLGFFFSGTKRHSYAVAQGKDAFLVRKLIRMARARRRLLHYVNNSGYFRGVSFRRELPCLGRALI